MQDLDVRRSSVESVDDVQATSTRMLIGLANDYSLYLKTDLPEQVQHYKRLIIVSQVPDMMMNSMN